MRFFLCFFLSLFLMGCSREIDYLPGFHFVDSQECHIESNNISSPLIVYLVKGYDLEITNDQIFLSEIRDAVERGCDVDEPDSDGLSPLNTAILFSQLEVIDELIVLGAKPNLVINSPKKSISGKNSFEFSEWLAINDPSKKRNEANALIQKSK